MRKVTASAVILTALTGCGQSSGIPSTQWSFDIPPEDKIGSAHLGNGFMNAESDADSTLDFAAQPWDSDAAADSGMMGPAFFQPESGALGGGLSIAGRPGGKELNSVGSEDYSSLLSTSPSHRSVSARPDPVAQVKAFLNANRSPSSLTNRAPFSSQVLLPSMPTVGTPMPVSTIASTLGDPTGMEARTVPSTSAVLPGASNTFASTSLPTVGFSSSGGAYSSVGEPETYTAARSRSPITGTVSAERSSGLPQPTITTEEGLPILAPIQETEIESRLPASEVRTQRPADMSIGTAILQDIQRTEPVPSVQNQPTVQNPSVAQAQPAAGFISIDVVPAATSSPEQLAAQPTLESLRRSMTVRELPPIVAEARMNASTPAEASQVSLSEASADPEIAISALSQPIQQEAAVADTSIRTDFPTLESLLETMPENAAEPNFEATLLEGQSASPLLEGLRSATPLSTLYMPIPPESAAEVTLADATESALRMAGQSANMLGDNSSDSSDAIALIGERVLRNALASMLAPDGNLRNVAGRLISQEGDRTKETVGAVDLVKHEGDSLAERQSQRNGAILSLVDKRSAKRRQLVTWQ